MESDRGWMASAGENGVTVFRTLRGVTETHILSPDILRGAEARRLDQAAGALQQRFAKSGKLISKGKQIAIIDGPIALFESVVEQGRKGLDDPAL